MTDRSKTKGFVHIEINGVVYRKTNPTPEDIAAALQVAFLPFNQAAAALKALSPRPRHASKALASATSTETPAASSKPRSRKSPSEPAASSNGSPRTRKRSGISSSSQNRTRG